MIDAGAQLVAPAALVGGLEPEGVHREPGAGHGDGVVRGRIRRSRHRRRGRVRDLLGVSAGVGLRLGGIRHGLSRLGGGVTGRAGRGHLGLGGIRDVLGRERPPHGRLGRGGHLLAGRRGLGLGRGEGRLVARLVGEEGTEEPHDDGLLTPVDEEVPHGEAQRALVPEPAEPALVVPITVDDDGRVDRSAPRAADEGRDRGRDARDGADAARNFLYVDAGVCRCDGHGPLLSPD